MPSIIDPIYGHVAISSFEQLIINTPEMARLRRISQLGLADFAFPGANHTRFEHSVGTLFIADSFNGRIRAVDPVTGLIRTVVGDGGEYRYQGPDEPPSSSLSRPSGIALDEQGNLFFTDSDNHLVRRWDRTTGRIERIAGVGVAKYGGDEGAALEAGLSYPFGIVMGRAGHLLVADTFNHRIRAIVL